MTTELPCLPCPFCGSKDIDPEGTACEHNGLNGYQATCETCHASGPEAADAWGAAYAWNARKP